MTTGEVIFPAGERISDLQYFSTGLIFFFFDRFSRGFFILLLLAKNDFGSADPHAAGSYSFLLPCPFDFVCIFVLPSFLPPSLTGCAPVGVCGDYRCVLELGFDRGL